MKIRDLFRSQEQTFSFEFFPPKSLEDVDALFDRARELQQLGVSFCSVTYGAGGSTRKNTIDLVCRLQSELDLVAMAHLTCVGHTQAELQEVLHELQDRGVENLMCLRGDPPQGQTEFIPTPDGFSYASELVQLVRTVGDFCIGVAGYPETHPECPDKQQDLEHLQAKVDCGADFVTTQLFFSSQDYFDFVDRGAINSMLKPLYGLLCSPEINPSTTVRASNRKFEIYERISGSMKRLRLFVVAVFCISLIFIRN